MYAPRRLISLLKPFRHRTKPGDLPGTVKSDPAAPACDIRVMAYNSNKLTELESVDPADTPEVIEAHAVTWINVAGLGTGDKIQQLGNLLDLHPLALEDVVNVHQNPKVEEYEKQLFIVLRMAHMSDDLDVEQVSLFLGPGYVLTFQERPEDCLDSVRKRLRKKRGRIREETSDYLAYTIIDTILDRYFPVMEKYGRQLDALETEVLEQADGDLISRIYHCRNEFMALRRLIWPHRDAIHTLIRDEHPLITASTRTYLRDCYDHTLQLIDVAETYREMCGSLRDLHFSLVGQRTNDVMRVLTIIATVFMPLSFIAGLYGMNFERSESRWNMPELGWSFGYPFALGLMASVAIGFLIFFWRLGWLKKLDR